MGNADESEVGQEAASLPLLQLRSFLLLNSKGMPSITEDNSKELTLMTIPGENRTFQAPFMLLAAAEFHRLVTQSSGEENRVQQGIGKWTHEIAELSFGVPSLKRFTIDVSDTKFKLVGPLRLAPPDYSSMANCSR